MKKEDMIVEAAKRTFTAVVSSLKGTSGFVVPFAVVGLISVKLWMAVFVIALMLAWEGYEHYKDVVAEEVEGIKADIEETASTANNAPVEEVSTEKKEQ